MEEAGQGCVIGGIKIEDFELGTVAHSDGDVLYHSATDALLGALGLPDIGQLFPDNDPRWRVRLTPCRLRLRCVLLRSPAWRWFAH